MNKITSIYRQKGEYQGVPYSKIVIQFHTQVKDLIKGQPVELIKISEKTFNEILQSKNLKVEQLEKITDISYNKYGQIKDIIF